MATADALRIGGEGRAGFRQPNTQPNRDPLPDRSGDPAAVQVAGRSAEG